MSQITRRKGDIEGSLKDVSLKSGKSLTTLLQGAEVIVLIDISSSMSTRVDMNKNRWEYAMEALASIQRAKGGKVAVCSFHSQAKWCFSGIIESPRGGTMVATALQHVQAFDGLGYKFILISDGEPMDRWAALEVAEQFKSHIDTVFIGSDYDGGKEFLDELARLTGGTSAGKVEPSMLGEAIKMLAN